MFRAKRPDLNRYWGVLVQKSYFGSIIRSVQFCSVSVQKQVFARGEKI